MVGSAKTGSPSQGTLPTLQEDSISTYTSISTVYNRRRLMLLSSRDYVHVYTHTLISTYNYTCTLKEADIGVYTCTMYTKHAKCSYNNMQTIIHVHVHGISKYFRHSARQQTECVCALCGMSGMTTHHLSLTPSQHSLLDT